MATARDIVTRSLKLIGVVADGETPTAQELSDGLGSLNDMLDSWSNDNVIIPYHTIEEFSLTAGKSRYSIGSSGDFDTIRPIEINKISYKDSSGFEIFLDKLTVEKWAEVRIKSIESSIQNCFYVENTYPHDYINFYPVPNSTNSIVIYSQKPLMSFSDLNTELTLPPGYSKAIRYNLAIEVAPEYGKEPNVFVLNGSSDSLKKIKNKNRRPRYIKQDLAVRAKSGNFNYYTGESE